MLLGKLSGSAPKSPPVVNDPTNLDEVIVSARPIEEALPEIVVSGTRIPWYVWLGVGVVGFAAVSAALSRK